MDGRIGCVGKWRCGWCGEIVGVGEDDVCCGLRGWWRVLVGGVGW